MKIWGNHDNQWQEGLFKTSMLTSIFKGLKVYEGIIIELKESSSYKEIELVLIHGH